MARPPHLDGSEDDDLIDHLFGLEPDSEDVTDDIKWTFVSGIKDAIHARRQTHIDLISSRGVGLFYGEKSNYRRMNASERSAYIARHLADASRDDVQMVKASILPRSCIGWTVQECCRIAFDLANIHGKYEEIRATTAREDWRVTELLKALRDVARFSLVKIGEDTGATRDRYLGGVDYEYVAPDDGLYAELQQFPFIAGSVPNGTHAFTLCGDSATDAQWDHEPHDPDAISWQTAPQYLNRVLEFYGAAYLAVPPTLFELSNN